MLIFVSILAFAALPLVGAAQSAQSDLKSLWQVQQPNGFQEALRSELGFSFLFGGKQIGPALPTNWTVAGKGDEMVFRDPTGLAVIRSARHFNDSDAVEYTVRFRNEGTHSLPALSSVNAVDLTFAGDVVLHSSVVSSGGDTAEAVYPPRDFAITRRYFAPMMPIERGEVTLSTGDGDSSRDNLPFFFLENQANKEGIFVGLGWTGDWKLSIKMSSEDRAIRVKGGMNGINLSLEPGEEISGPEILLGSYRGTLSTGSNRLRRLIRDHYQPSVAGNRLSPPILFSTWFDVGAELDDKVFRSLVDDAAGIGQEVFLQDAGWYEGVTNTPYTDMGATWKNISNPLGNWELGEDRRKFPQGLKPLADYVRSKGMMFGLWFEPERSGPNSLIARQHPDWVTFIPNHAWGMVDLGNPAVQAYLCGIFDRYIKDFGVRYIRWDQNNELLPYWASKDRPGREGLAQIRHIEGLHHIEDWIRKNHPEVILESCASGGRRIDLQTLARRQTLWLSDETMDPLIVRFHLEGANLFLPGNGLLVGFVPPTSVYQKAGVHVPDIAFQSYFGGAFGSGGRLFDWPPELKAQARKHFDAYKKVRGFLAEDYYALVPQPKTLEEWAGWQFANPERGDGFVQAFRLNSPETVKWLPLHGLDANATYEFTDVYTGQKWSANGSDLIQRGLEFRLPEMSSRVLLYRRSN